MVLYGLLKPERIRGWRKGRFGPLRIDCICQEGDQLQTAGLYINTLRISSNNHGQTQIHVTCFLDPLEFRFRVVHRQSARLKPDSSCLCSQLKSAPLSGAHSCFFKSSAAGFLLLRPRPHDIITIEYPDVTRRVLTALKCLSVCKYAMI